MLRRIARKIISSLKGSKPTPPPASPRYQPPPPPDWLAQDPEEDTGHSHDHGHSHSHDEDPPTESDATPITVYDIETPNPNARKFSVDQALFKISFSASSSKEAEGNPMAEALIACEGVASIFGVNDFITVTKKSDANWPDMIPKIIETIQNTVSSI